MLSAVFTVAHSAELLAVFAAEDKELSNARAQYSLHPDEDELRIEVTAEDAIALRAMVNAVSKVLAIFEKMQQVK